MTTTYISDGIVELTMSGIQSNEQLLWLMDVMCNSYITDMEYGIIKDLVGEYNDRQIDI